jgi:hypothetical protein
MLHKVSYPPQEADASVSDEDEDFDRAEEAFEQAIKNKDLPGVKRLLKDGFVTSETFFSNGISAIALAFVTEGCDEVFNHLLSDSSLEVYGKLAMEQDKGKAKHANLGYFQNHNIIELTLEKKLPHAATLILEHHKNDLQPKDVNDLQNLLEAREVGADAKKELEDHLGTMCDYWPYQHEVDVWLFKSFFPQLQRNEIIILPATIPSELNATWLKNIAKGEEKVIFHKEYSKDASVLEEEQLDRPYQHILAPLVVNRNHYTLLVLKYSQGDRLQFVYYIDPKPATPLVLQNYQVNILPTLQEKFSGIEICPVNLCQVDDVFCSEYIFSIIKRILQQPESLDNPKLLDSLFLSDVARLTLRCQMCATLGFQFFKDRYTPQLSDTQTIEEKFRLVTNHAFSGQYSTALVRRSSDISKKIWHTIQQYWYLFFSNLLSRRYQKNIDQKAQFIIFKNIDTNSQKCYWIFSICLKTDSLGDLTLCLKMIETILEEKFGIRRRAYTMLPIKFHLENRFWAYISYSGEELIPTSQNDFNIEDKLLRQVFTDPQKDYTNYVRQHLIYKLKVISSTKQRIVVVTNNPLGSGNFMHALRTIEALIKLDSNLHIDWFVIKGRGKEVSRPNFPDNVHFMCAVEFWEMYPAIVEHHKSACMTLSIPNEFLIDWDEMFQLKLATEAHPITCVMEYNILDQCSQNNVTVLYSGIPTTCNSHFLGILKPKFTFFLENDITVVRETIRDEISALQSLSFEQDVPFYFSYLYRHTPGDPSNIMGLTVHDALALFLAHMKKLGSAKADVVLPVEPEDIPQAQIKYPTIFKGCQIKMRDQLYQHQHDIGPPTQHINIVNAFPFKNKIFRLLIMYAMHCKTPLIMTGDQSFLELFFSSYNEFTFLYQVLGHKKQFANDLLGLMQEKNLVTLTNLFKLTQQGPITEKIILNCVSLLIEKKECLHQECRKLVKTIQELPEFSQVLFQHIQKRYLPEQQQSQEQSTDESQGAPKKQKLEDPLAHSNHQSASSDTLFFVPNNPSQEGIQPTVQVRPHTQKSSLREPTS